jgi:hypothetical protein
MADDMKARREAAEAEIAKLEADAAAEREARAVALLEARVKYSKELGREGVDFKVIDAGGEGMIVLKLAPMVVYQNFHSALQESDKVSLSIQERFILPCVAFPEKREILEILNRRPVLYRDLCDALLVLHGANEGEKKGK